MLATAHSSYWHQTADSTARHYPALESDLHVDVAILGGGITGLTAAVHLKQAGRKVAVLEAAEIGSGTTGSTSGHLDATTDLALPRMIFDFGESAAATITAATRQAIDQIETWCRKWADCEFRRISSYQFTEQEAGLKALQKQCAAARKLGFDTCFTDFVPLPFRCQGAVQISGQGRLHSQRYLQHLAAKVDGDGSAVFENTMAQPPEEGRPAIVQTGGGRVTADVVVVATHSPYLGLSEFEFRVFPYQSYVIGVRVHDTITDALYWDDAEPYHYLRLASPFDPGLVLIGGADHKTGQAVDERERFKELEQYALERFTVETIEHHWSAQHYVPADGLPHIGRVPGMDHVFIATGFAGTGLTWGTVAGALIAKEILGQRHPLHDILKPGRVTLLASAREVITENLDVMRHFVADRFANPTSDGEEQIPPGSGQIVNHNGHLVAAYRNSSGVLFRFSPICTHAGCVVHWNGAEKTWDCPCHGGRFTAEGRRFCGPPVGDLEPDDGG